MSTKTDPCITVVALSTGRECGRLGGRANQAACRMPCYATMDRDNPPPLFSLAERPNAKTVLSD